MQLTQQQDKALHDVKLANENHRHTLLLEIDGYKTDITELKKTLSQKNKMFEELQAILNAITQNQLAEKQRTESLMVNIQNQDILLSNHHKSLEAVILKEAKEISQNLKKVMTNNSHHLSEELSAFEKELQNLKGVLNKHELITGR